MDVDVYRAARRRLSDVVTGLTDEQLDTMVPAAPKWTVRELFTHVVAISSDLSKRPVEAPVINIPPPDFITAAHVAARSELSPAELVAEWATSAPLMEERLAVWDRWTAPVHDLLCHEADIRGALLLPRMPETAWGASLDEFAGFLTEFEPILTRRWSLPDTGMLVVETGDRTYTLGSGDPTASVTAPGAYELWRAMFGRRSQSQLRSWDWSTDPEPYLDALPFFDITDKDLTEP